VTLIERLLRLGTLWADASNRSTATLATIVVNDGKLFERLEAGKTCTIDTFERFLSFLGNPANWPVASGISAEAAELLASVRMDAASDHPNIITAADGSATGGKFDEISALGSRAALAKEMLGHGVTA